MFVDDRKKFTLVVIQLSSLCNLNCSYCYVPDRSNKQLMDVQVWEKILKLTVGDKKNTGKSFDFLFHAGEPLAIGLTRFKEYVDLCVERAVEGVNYSFSVQTNGTLIDTNWAKFLKEYDFSVGISIDGPEDINDAQRVNWSGRGTLEKSIQGIQALKDQGHENFGCLAVVGIESLSRPAEIMSFFFDEIGVSSVGFNIEDIDGVNVSTSFGEDRETNKAKIRKSLVEPFYEYVFDFWFPRRDKISIREFSDVLRPAAMIRTDASYVREPDIARPLGIITISREGDVTTFAPEFASVDPSKFDEFNIGNVMNVDTLDELKDSDVFKRLSADVLVGVNACKSECEYFPICGSAHISNRYFEYGDLSRPDTFTCEMMLKAAADVCFRKINALNLETHS